MNAQLPSASGCCHRAVSIAGVSVWHHFLCVVGALLCLVNGQGAEVPERSGWVNDPGQVLDSEAKKRMEAILSAFTERSPNQVAVLVLSSLGWGNLGDYSSDVMFAWKLGGEDFEDGVLLLVVPSERKVHIEAGDSFEDILTEEALQDIIRETILPQFERDQMDAGIERGVQAIIDRIEGKLVSGGTESSRKGTAGSGDVDMPLADRILFGAFIFGILGLFTALGLFIPGSGWFLYFFLIPFWALFPVAVLGMKANLVLFGFYLVGFPIAKVLISRTEWYRRKNGLLGIGRR